MFVVNTLIYVIWSPQYVQVNVMVRGSCGDVVVYLLARTTRDCEFPFLGYVRIGRGFWVATQQRADTLPTGMAGLQGVRTVAAGLLMCRITMFDATVAYAKAS